MDREQFLRLAANPNADLNNLRFIQQEIAQMVILKDDFIKPIKYLGGVDSAYIDDTVITACVILKWPDLELIEQKFVVSEAKFPYISTFFAFREGASILEVLSHVKMMPTILMIDSQGIAHPTFAGCASHIGVIANLPTIGVAKNVLCGEWESEPIKVGDWVSINFQTRQVGAYFLSQERNKPIIISPGHRITLKTAVNIVKKSLKKHKMPIPLHLAHQLANEEKSKLKNANL
ncbi:MAG: endonuclease V [Candidatus Helarchaeota archaeon]|nr:endonuclease V [Candidatus Helarchaeota archaeon]